MGLKDLTDNDIKLILMLLHKERRHYIGIDRKSSCLPIRVLGQTILKLNK